MQKVSRKSFLKSTILALPALALAKPPVAHAVPLFGMSGVCPNASALATYLTSTYSGIQSIGGIRPDRLPDHPSGHAIDIMIGSNMGLGDSIAKDIRSQSERFGVKYVLWRVPDHYNHIHVTVF